MRPHASRHGGPDAEEAEGKERPADCLTAGSQEPGCRSPGTGGHGRKRARGCDTQSRRSTQQPEEGRVSQGSVSAMGASGAQTQGREIIK